MPLGRRLPSGERLHASTVPAVVRLLLSSREGELYVKVNCLRGRCGPHSIRGAGCVCCGSGVRIPSHHRRKQAMSVEGRRDVRGRRPRRGRPARGLAPCPARGVALSVALSVVARAARGDGPDARAGPHQPHNPSRRPASPVRSVHTTYTHAHDGVAR